MRGSFRLLGLLVGLTLLVGCAKWLPTKQAPVPKEPAPAPVAAPPPETASDLFPLRDIRLVFHVADRGKEPVRVVEEWLRNNDQVVATYNGNPYVTWLIREDGVWRKDPKGDALLRYLPGTLADGEAWKQTSGDADVWFRLVKERHPYGPLPNGYQPDSYWRLTVLNRGEQTEFLFATGAGAVFAYAETWRNPAAAFRKELNQVEMGALTTGDRAALLSRAKPGDGAPAPVAAVTGAEFLDALVKARPDSPSVSVDLDGDGTAEVVRGLINTWTAYPVFILDEGHSIVGVLEPAPGEQMQATLRDAAPGALPLLLYQSGQPGDPGESKILQAHRRVFLGTHRSWEVAASP